MKYLRHRGAGRRDPRHAGLGTPTGTGPITVSLGNADIAFDVVDFNVTISVGVTVILGSADIAFDVVNPEVVLGATTATLGNADIAFDVVNPTVVVTAGNVIELWIRVNGIDVPGTTFSKAVIDNQPIALSYDLKLKEGDYVELMYSVGNIATILYSLPAESFRPAVPSALLNVKEI